MDANPTDRSLDPGSPSPRLSVAAPTYQRRAGLPRFVNAVLADPVVSELVMAVDGSTDGSLEWLRERAQEDERLVVLDLPNRGVAAARQAAIEATSGDVVLLLDDDVIAEPGLASGHLREHLDGGRRLVLGYTPNDWRSLPLGRRGIGYLYSRDYEAQCARYASDPEFVMCGLWGGNFSLRREDFLAHPFAALEVKRGTEDREFGVRCFKDGIRGRFDRSLVGRHEYARSLPQYRRDCRMGGRSRRLLWNLHADVLGDDLGLGRALPRPLRWMLVLAARDPLFVVASWALTGIFELGVRTRLLGLEAFAARALGALETQRGALEA